MSWQTKTSPNTYAKKERRPHQSVHVLEYDQSPLVAPSYAKGGPDHTSRVKSDMSLSSKHIGIFVCHGLFD